MPVLADLTVASGTPLQGPDAFRTFIKEYVDGWKDLLEQDAETLPKSLRSIYPEIMQAQLLPSTEEDPNDDTTYMTAYKVPLGRFRGIVIPTLYRNGFESDIPDLWSIVGVGEGGEEDGREYAIGYFKRPNFPTSQSGTGQYL